MRCPIAQSKKISGPWGNMRQVQVKHAPTCPIFMSSLPIYHPESKAPLRPEAVQNVYHLGQNSSEFQHVLSSEFQHVLAPAPGGGYAYGAAVGGGYP